jgi:hypothetical protein
MASPSRSLLASFLLGALSLSLSGSAAAEGTGPQRPTTSAQRLPDAKRARPLPSAEDPPRTLRFADFWTIAGVSRADSREEVVRKWGAVERSEPDRVFFQDGPSVTFLPGGRMMLRFPSTSGPFVEKHADAVLSLWRMSCSGAERRLPFRAQVRTYTVCRHFSPDAWFFDVSLTCSDGLISDLVVTWEHLPAALRSAPVPADRCD